MKDIFQHIENNEMVLAVKSFRLVGKAKCMFALLNILANTMPIEQDRDWWQVRSYILANDRDTMLNKLSMEQRLAMRIN